MSFQVLVCVKFYKGSKLLSQTQVLFEFEFPTWLIHNIGLNSCLFFRSFNPQIYKKPISDKMQFKTGNCLHGSQGRLISLSRQEFDLTSPNAISVHNVYRLIDIAVFFSN